jgi:hypothetical protein
MIHKNMKMQFKNLINFQKQIQPMILIRIFKKNQMNLLNK